MSVIVNSSADTTGGSSSVVELSNFHSLFFFCLPWYLRVSFFPMLLVATVSLFTHINIRHPADPRGHLGSPAVDIRLRVIHGSYLRLGLERLSDDSMSTREKIPSGYEMKQKATKIDRTCESVSTVRPHLCRTTSTLQQKTSSFHIRA